MLKVACLKNAAQTRLNNMGNATKTNSKNAPERNDIYRRVKETLVEINNEPHLEMAASLVSEINNHLKNVRHVKRLLRSTQQSLEEIRNSGAFYREQLVISKITNEDLERIAQSVDRPPTIIVHGQNFYAKAAVTNELFNQRLLPAASSGEGHRCWRAVRLKYGPFNQISLALPDSYELVEHYQAFVEQQQSPWGTVPAGELQVSDDAMRDPKRECAVLEILLPHALLKESVEVLVTSSNPSTAAVTVSKDFATTFAMSLQNCLPIVIYAIAEDVLSESNKEDLKTMQNLLQDVPILFIRVPSTPSTELTESEQHAQMEQQKQRRVKIQQSHQRHSHQQHRRSRSDKSRPPVISDAPLDLFHQLRELGFLSIVPTESFRLDDQHRPMVVASELVESLDDFPFVTSFVRTRLQSIVVNATSDLNRVHNCCLKMFINAAFDMARDLLITPKKIEYVKKQESKLYDRLMEIANLKQEEIKKLITETIAITKIELLEKAAVYEFQGVTVLPGGQVSSTRELRICTGEIQDLVLTTLHHAVADKLLASIQCLRESVVGTLQRCLESLEKVFEDGRESPQASTALKQQILTAAYQVEVTVRTSSSVMNVFWEKMKQLVQSMPGKTTPHIDSDWKCKVALDMIQSLSEWRLAKSICSQFRDKLKTAHEAFASSMRQLESHHSGRLERTEEQRLKVKKIYTPKVARYALESASLRDVVLYGTPHLGKEIGRGQYGVVYSCESWGGHHPCAIKSVVPPDDKHWNDLALEFLYTRGLPEHDRIVKLQGSVIDYTYAGGSTPAVLLIMERLQRDLHNAIRDGLDWITRLQVAVDVIEGIRFLHGQGLVHRDIKLKNVLLDRRCRAKLTDLGFCKPEAMMSGSIVGTPIHMAPELFCGKYDHRVDVYAFGIVFWYICAGHIRLPYVYEQCQNKDQLWVDVKRGVRPERLPQFNDECWSLMEECWAGNPADRPHLGDAESRLRSIIEYYRNHPAPQTDFHQREVELLSSSPYIEIEFRKNVDFT